MPGLPSLDLLAFLLTIQLALGAAIYAVTAWLLARFDRSKPRGRRRRLVAWAASARALCRLAPLATGLAGLAGLSHGVRTGSFDELAAIWPHPTTFLALGALPAASSYVLLHAGRQERRGALRRARAEAGLGGRLLFCGVFFLQLLVWTDLLFDSSFRRAVLAVSPVAALALTASILVLGLAAFTSLVAGLAGKPRPSGPFAVLLYVLGLFGLVVAAGVSRLP